MLRIRQALEKAVLAVAPAIDTAFENTTFKPRANEPYQQLHFLPAKPEAAVIDDSISEVLGVFQITFLFILNLTRSENGSKSRSHRRAAYQILHLRY